LEVKSLLERFYSGNYRYYIALPAVLFFVFAFLAFVNPGLEQGIDLKGGTLVVVSTKSMVNAQDIASAINSKFDLTELSVIPFQGGVQVQYGSNRVLASAKSDIEKAKGLVESNQAQSLAICKKAVSSLSAYAKPEKQSFASASECLAFAGQFYSEASDAFKEELNSTIFSSIGEKNIQEGSTRETQISPALGRLFWSQAQVILLIALVAVIIVIFAFFRAVVPSMAVILAATFDILAALGLMAVFRISFSIASMSSLLMLVGYSVDTDIMLTTRLLKRKFKTVRESAADSMLTGLTMTGTTLGALVVMLIFSSLWNLDVLFSIAAVLLFGLLGDLVSTWFMNAPVLMLYAERKRRRVK